MTGMRWMAILAVACAGWTGAAAQVDAPQPSAPMPPQCPPDTQSLPLEALFGRWELHIDGQPGTAIVEMARHPDYAGVRGTVTREGAQAPSQIAGDIDDEGLLSIDQSDDGHTINAVWSGSMKPGSCGKVFEGTWRKAADESSTHFVLRKLSSARGNTTPSTQQ
jgi:hypothetical protein